MTRHHSIASSWGLVLVILAAFSVTHAADVSVATTGAISGRVFDELTDDAIVACSISVNSGSAGTQTGKSGEFHLTGLSFGSLELIVSHPGYQIANVIHDLAPNDTTALQIPLIRLPIPLTPVFVTGDRSLPTPSSIPSFRMDSRQVQSDAGAIGDVGRALLILPSTGRVQDNSNDLIVRGGSPLENSYYVDDIPIPNINHFPVQGSTAGAVTMFGGDVVEGVSLQPGGFAATYDDALSSIVEVNLREGSREKLHCTAEGNLIGVSGTVEGPLPNHSGSWLIGARRSHLSLLVDALNTPEVPGFEDGQGKLVFDISPAHSVSLLGTYANSKLILTRSRAIEKDFGSYGDFRATQYMNGVRWRWTWGTTGAATTTLSYVRSRVEQSTFWTSSQQRYYQNRSDDRDVVARSTIVRVLGTHTIEGGFTATRLRSTQNFETGHYYTSDGDVILPTAYDRELWQTSTGLHISHTWSPTSNYSVSSGLRLDHSGLRNEYSLSPRLSARWTPHERFSLHGALGIYRQDLPAFLLMQSEAPRSMDDLQGTHAVLGVRTEVARTVSLSIDGYLKGFTHFPLDADRPDIFVVDEATSLQGFNYYPGLNGDGKAKSKGIEILAEFEPAATLRAMVSLSLSDTRYRDMESRWHERAFNNGTLIHATLKYQPRHDWTLDLRWSYSGGVPYTPYDLELSDQYGRGILDTSRVNSENLPAYHALHIRCERKWTVHGTVLFSYVGVMNAYNRDNVAYYYWNFSDYVVEEQNQWGILPVMGLRWQF